MKEKQLKEKEEKLKLIPKVELYIEYMIAVIIKLPRIEKFSIGTEYKSSMYKMIENIMILNKITKKDTREIIGILNNIDALLNTQRIYLRIMKNNRWIDEKKFKVAMEQIYEIGKILGGLIKYYFRYLDDSVLIVKTKQEAKLVLLKIQKFLIDNLKLELDKKTQIFKNKQGVNFCGYKINEYRLKIRDKGKRKLKKKVKKLKKEIKDGKLTSKEAKKYLAGHLGYIQIANVKNLTDKLFYNEEEYI